MTGYIIYLGDKYECISSQPSFISLDKFYVGESLGDWVWLEGEGTYTNSFKWRLISGRLSGDTYNFVDNYQQNKFYSIQDAIAYMLKKYVDVYVFDSINEVREFITGEIGKLNLSNSRSKIHAIKLGEFLNA